MSSDAPLRVIATQRVSAQKRLLRISDPPKMGGLRAVRWHAVARTDDGLTIVIVVDLSAEFVNEVIGVRVTETDDSVSLEVFGRGTSSDRPRALLSFQSDFLVDLDRPLGGRSLHRPG